MLKQQNACFLNVLYLCLLNNCIIPPLPHFKHARVARKYNHLHSNKQEKLPYFKVAFGGLQRINKRSYLI
jgi:hypothetical protein